MPDPIAERIRLGWRTRILRRNRLGPAGSQCRVMRSAGLPGLVGPDREAGVAHNPVDSDHVPGQGAGPRMIGGRPDGRCVCAGVDTARTGLRHWPGVTSSPSATSLNVPTHYERPHVAVHGEERSSSRNYVRVVTRNPPDRGALRPETSKHGRPAASLRHFPRPRITRTDTVYPPPACHDGKPPGLQPQGSHRTVQLGISAEQRKLEAHP